LPLGCFY